MADNNSMTFTSHYARSHPGGIRGALERPVDELGLLAAIREAIGALGGGSEAREVTATMDAHAEDAFWRRELGRRPYFERQFSYDRDYARAYAFGYAARLAWPDGDFGQAVQELQARWKGYRGRCRLEWSRASDAVADGWRRCEELATPAGAASNNYFSPSAGSD